MQDGSKLISLSNSQKVSLKQQEQLDLLFKGIIEHPKDWKRSDGIVIIKNHQTFFYLSYCRGFFFFAIKTPATVL